eukprot:3117928-Rhodomonas_salina.5
MSIRICARHARHEAPHVRHPHPADPIHFAGKAQQHGLSRESDRCTNSNASSVQCFTLGLVFNTRTSRRLRKRRRDRGIGVHIAVLNNVAGKLDSPPLNDAGHDNRLLRSLSLLESGPGAAHRSSAIDETIRLEHRIHHGGWTQKRFQTRHKRVRRLGQSTPRPQDLRRSLEDASDGQRFVGERRLRYYGDGLGCGDSTGGGDGDGDHGVDGASALGLGHVCRARYASVAGHNGAANGEDDGSVLAHAASERVGEKKRGCHAAAEIGERHHCDGLRPTRIARG